MENEKFRAKLAEWITRSAESVISDVNNLELDDVVLSKVLDAVQEASNIIWDARA